MLFGTYCQTMAMELNDWTREPIVSQWTGKSCTGSCRSVSNEAAKMSTCCKLPRRNIWNNTIDGFFRLVLMDCSRWRNRSSLCVDDTFSSLKGVLGRVVFFFSTSPFICAWLHTGDFTDLMCYDVRLVLLCDVLMPRVGDGTSIAHGPVGSAIRFGQVHRTAHGGFHEVTPLP